MTYIEKIKKEIESELSVCESNNLYDNGRRSALNHIKLFISCMQKCNDEDEIRSDWKPSEEQLGALNYAYCEIFASGKNTPCLHILQNLIDDLKKTLNHGKI